MFRAVTVSLIYLSKACSLVDVKASWCKYCPNWDVNSRSRVVKYSEVGEDMRSACVFKLGGAV